MLTTLHGMLVLEKQKMKHLSAFSLLRAK